MNTMQMGQCKAPVSSSSSLAGRPVTSQARAQLRAARKSLHVTAASKSQRGRWKGMDADQDTSDDQQDIARGRMSVDSLYQGGQGMGGTHNAVLSSEEYLSSAARNLNNIEDGFYISPAFLDKISIHVAKNFLDLPKIKVPLILGIWGGQGQDAWCVQDGGDQPCALVCTGNDFSTLPFDFFGALRARVYDDKVREFVLGMGIENIGKRLVNSREGKVEFEKPQMSLEALM
ncbi:hypothetical protein WJX84_006701, partial [Apatococcus fuscideae]